MRCQLMDRECLLLARKRHPIARNRLLLYPRMATFTGILLRRHGGGGQRIGRVLWNDPAIGLMRHADAGYDEAIECARENRLNLPDFGIGGK